MKKNVLKQVLQIIITIATAIISTITTTSCMGM